ncbi:RING finger protein 112-like, partial [Mustelus asterias]
MGSAIGEALQLVEFVNESICVNDDVLSSCLLNKAVEDLPVCLVSIIGEERTGKSFLLNYLLRRLKNLDGGYQDWMGAEDEDLQGFACRPGINSTTQGVFIWNKPFLMDTQQGKMAIFLVETEGYNSLEREKNTSIQLSAFSMFLSSYLIFNIASKIDPTHLEFLEMFLDVAQKVGEVVNLDPIQHLDILVRDCDGNSMHGKAAGRTYLEATLQKIANSKTKYQPFMKKKVSKAQCFLLPHPGEAIAHSSTGHRKEMTERFRHYLLEYFRCVLDSLPMSGWRDMSGSILTCRQLFDQIKLFAKTIEQYSLKIQTPLQ